MKKEYQMVEGIPAIIWGAPSDRAYLYVHGKLSSKEAAADFAAIAQERGYQTVSFDLPQHGDRAGEQTPCDVWHGTADLRKLTDFAFANWKTVSLYACSLGAYFSLQCLADRPLEKCCFQSPIVDMEHLIRKMMLWFGITEERLAQEKEVETPIDRMSWDYYQYVLAHPAAHWPHPTAILYAGQDNLQSAEVIEAFASRFGCTVTIEPDSEHPFLAEGDAQKVERWYRSVL